MNALAGKLHAVGAPGLTRRTHNVVTANASGSERQDVRVRSQQSTEASTSSSALSENRAYRGLTPVRRNGAAQVRGRQAWAGRCHEAPQSCESCKPSSVPVQMVESAYSTLDDPDIHRWELVGGAGPDKCGGPVAEGFSPPHHPEILGPQP